MPDPAPEEIRAFMSGLRIARRMSMRNTPTGGRPVNRSGKEALFDKDLTRRLQSHQSAPTAGKADGELLNKLRNGAREHKLRSVSSSQEMMISLRTRIAAWRDVKQVLATEANKRLSTTLNFNFVVIDRPVFVLPTPDLIISGESLAPWDNVVKFSAEWDTPYPDNGTDEISYIFAWTNPSDR